LIYGAVADLTMMSHPPQGGTIALCAGLIIIAASRQGLHQQHRTQTRRRSLKPEDDMKTHRAGPKAANARRRSNIMAATRSA
jgi:hypothetical protein